jgi:glutathione peroxidase
MNSKQCLSTVVSLLLALAASVYADQPTTPRDSSMTTPPYFSIPFQTITGEPKTLSDFHGQVLLLVNVASECGYTYQYEGLEKLYETYKDRGLVVIGFPANNFGAQEPGTNAEIATFCKTKYSVTFPMMSKISVKGDDIHPLYAYLRTQPDSTFDLSWNFNKFLIDRHGKVVARFNQKVKPEDSALVSPIEQLLAQPK